MARIKQTARQSTGGRAPRKQLCSSACRWPVCYELDHGKRYIPASRTERHSQLPESHSQDKTLSKKIVNLTRPKLFLYFAKLPLEVQNNVWEMLAKEPRIVAVHTKTNNGLYSSIPPILHVCSESRAIGLKHCTLAFGGPYDLVPPRVYFNFERDTLYFRDDWNKDVNGAWCCLSNLTILVNEDDLKRVRRVGLDNNARVCSLKTSSQRCHMASFARWDAVEIMYLGLEKQKLGSDCPIRFSELETKDYKRFMQRYYKNPCWRNTRLVPQQEDEAAIESLRNEVPIRYHGYWNGGSDSFLRKLELVSVKHL